jgi:site-specific recombinase XerD
MTWDYWIKLYTGTHCVARGLRAKTIAAYRMTLHQFEAFVIFRLDSKAPHVITTCDVLTYIEHLRSERHNGASAINRQATILRSFYRAMVALELLEHHQNPMAMFPRIKAAPRKLPFVLNEEQVHRLLDAPPRDTVIGLRDRAMLVLLYGTGMRASECAMLCDEDVDLDHATIRVTGKGGHERTLPLNASVVESLSLYREHRGVQLPHRPFFLSRSNKALSRNAVYERVRKYGRQSKVNAQLSPHKLRHTFATHLVRAGVNLVTIRDLLGHRQLSSTQIYLHVTAEDLRVAANRHPVARLTPTVDHLLAKVKLPFQPPPRRREQSG